MKNQLTIPAPRNRWLPLVLITLLTIAIFIISIISLLSGWQTIFQNLFYFPIILACVYYVKRGFVFSVFLACGYFVLMACFSQDFAVLEGAFIRVLIFILVAGVITYLSIVRIRAEDALKESEEFNRGLVENMPNLVLVYDHDRKIRYVNPTASTILGYSSEEMVGTDIVTYVIPHQHAEIAAAIEERFSSGRGESLEVEFITKAGLHLTVISKGAPLRFRNQPAVLVLLADITDRKRIEEALQESEERYRSLYADSRDAIMIVSPTRGFLAANPATVRLFACQNEQDFTSQTPMSLSPEYQPDGVRSEDKAQEMMHLALKNGSHFFEWTHRKMNGPDFPATVLLSRLESGGTQILQATVRDITEHKQAENALRLANKKLTLLSSITRHDINNQLTVLVGYLIILKKKQPDPTFNEYFVKVSTAAQRISSMIQFTREYEAIGMSTPVWLGVRTILDTAAKEAPLGQVIVKNNLPVGNEVFADPLIEKVFYNLMDNAARYGGKITTIRFSVEERDGDHVVVCEDDGEGVVVGEKEKIFERGFGKNTGLGLTLSREILSITGITIRETGEPGKGARFEMVVPKGAWRMKGDGA